MGPRLIDQGQIRPRVLFLFLTENLPMSVLQEENQRSQVVPWCVSFSVYSVFCFWFNVEISNMQSEDPGNSSVAKALLLLHPGGGEDPVSEHLTKPQNTPLNSVAISFVDEESNVLTYPLTKGSLQCWMSWLDNYKFIKHHCEKHTMWYVSKYISLYGQQNS